MSDATRRRSGKNPARAISVPVFLLIQTVVLAAVAFWGAYRLGVATVERALPRLRAEPLTLTPRYDEPSVVSDGQLARVVARLGLRFAGAETSVTNVDHGLRLWGRGARLGDAGFMSGPDMLRLLTQQEVFEHVYGDLTEPLLIDDGVGVSVRVGEGRASTSHYDHLLATLAELGASLSHPVRTPQRSTTLQALLERSLRDFSLNQAEYEWSALTYALFLPPVDSWITSEGQQVDFGRLAERIMRPALPDGVCSANHRLYALTAFLQVDDLMQKQGQPPLLAAAARGRVEEFLTAVTAAFVRHQHPDGFWNFDWPFAPPATSEPTAEEGDRLSDRIIVTGHVLEWWALAPPGVLPPPEVRVAAGQWLVRTIDRLSDEEIQEYFSYLSHAGRALALWRGRLPAEVLAPLGEDSGSGPSGEPGEVG